MAITTGVTFDRAETRRRATRRNGGLETILADPQHRGLAHLDDGKLIVSPLPAEQLPAETDTLT